jgi:hypothetical protein
MSEDGVRDASAGGVAPNWRPWRRSIRIVERPRARRDVVVEEALGDVEDPTPRQGQAFEEELEVGHPGLVAAGLLGGHDPVELDPEPAVRGGEEVVVAVREDAQAEVPLQAGQGGRRIREGGPVADGAAERLDLRWRGFDAVARGDRLEARQDVAAAR